MKNLDKYRTAFNKSDLLGLFDEYLEDNEIYSKCGDYDKLIEKIKELQANGLKAPAIVDEIIVYLDEQYEFHPDKDLEDEEMAEIWREDMLETVEEVMAD